MGLKKILYSLFVKNPFLQKFELMHVSWCMTRESACEKSTRYHSYIIYHIHTYRPCDSLRMAYHVHECFKSICIWFYKRNDHSWGDTCVTSQYMTKINKMTSTCAASDISDQCILRPWKGGPSTPYPFNYFEKTKHIPKIDMTYIPKIQKAFIPISLNCSKYPVSL